MDVLFVSSWFPYPPTNGARVRSWKMLAALTQAGHRCHLFSLERPDPGDDWRALVPAGLDVVFEDGPAPRPGRWKSRFALLGLTPRHFRLTFSAATLRQVQSLVDQWHVEAVVAFELSAGVYVARLRGSHLRRVLDDCEPFQIAPRRRQLGAAGRTWKFWRFLRQLLNEYDAFLTVSELELDWISRHLNLKCPRGFVVANGADLHEPYRGRVDLSRVIYTGSVTYWPNWEAVDYFVRLVWPGVREAEPKAQFVVTGQLPAVGAVDGLGSLPGLTLAGLVDDYPTFVSSSGVLAVPLASGGGTRIKILEALALGCPVVASPKAVEGLALVPGCDVLVATTPAEFVGHVLAVMRDGQLRRQLVEQGRRAVTRYDWKLMQQKFVDIVEGDAGVPA